MLFINLLGVLLIVAIVWWFWLYKPETSSAETGNLLITVENGVYQPARVRIATGKETSITFLRKDASPCAEALIFPDLDISEELPLDREKIIRLPALQSGSYPFHCQMKMYKGELVVGE